MIHILFSDASARSLKMALKSLGKDKMEKVISFWDKFSIGPSWRLHEEKGVNARFDWMRDVMNDEDEEIHYKKVFRKSLNQIKAIPDGVAIIIWIADNSHEQTGLRYVLHLLKNMDNDIMVINTTKKHSELFSERDIEYTVLHTGEIHPEKIQDIYEYSKSQDPFTKHERKDLENEWLSLSDNQETLRIWENGRIQSVPEDYFDQFIIQRAKYLYEDSEMDGFMKSARLIGDALGHLEQHVSDSFLEYRLRKLIDARVFESKGNLKAMRLYSVRLRK